jgi:hypothetical protein
LTRTSPRQRQTGGCRPKVCGRGQAASKPTATNQRWRSKRQPEVRWPRLGPHRGRLQPLSDGEAGVRAGLCRRAARLVPPGEARRHCHCHCHCHRMSVFGRTPDRVGRRGRSRHRLVFADRFARARERRARVQVRHCLVTSFHGAVGRVRPVVSTRTSRRGFAVDARGGVLHPRIGCRYACPSRGIPLRGHARSRACSTDERVRDLSP